MNNTLYDSKLKQALEIYIDYKISRLPSLEELQDIHKFSPEFERKMDRLIRRNKKPYYKMINSIGKRVAVFIVTLLIAVSVTIISVDALRKNVFDFLVNIYEDFISIFYDKTPEDNTENKIDEFFVPQYIPEGYEIISNEVQHGAVLKIYSNTKNRFIFSQFVLSINLNIDIENREYEKVDINGNIGIFYTEKGINHIVWDDSKYCFEIKGSISKDEIIKIAKSLAPQ